MTLSSLSFVFRTHRTKAGKSFPGSMGPKIEAAIKFVEESENPNAWAAIGDMKDAANIMSNEEGTIVSSLKDNKDILRRMKDCEKSFTKSENSERRSTKCETL